MKVMRSRLIRELRRAVVTAALIWIPAPVYAQAPAPPASSPAAVPAISPEFRTKLHRLFDLMGVSDVMAQAIDSQIKIMRPSLIATPGLTPEFADEFLKRFRERILSGSEITETLEESYAGAFTPGEVDGIIAFYESPVGRKVREVQPKMMESVGAQMAVVGRRLGREIAEQVAKDHPEYLKAAPAASPQP